MNKNEDAQILVNLKFEDGRAIYNLGFPSSKQKLTLEETAHILTGAISMLIRSVNPEKDGVTEHQLMKDVISHLNMSYTDPKAFEDAEVKRENLPAKPMDLTQNQMDEIIKLEKDEKMNPFQKQFEIAKVLGVIKKNIKYSDKMSLKEYQKIFKQTTK